ncbi:DUF229 domain-containing protein [bacterium]|nr:DUF229 domain-containing protein [bacterium]
MSANVGLQNLPYEDKLASCSACRLKSAAAENCMLSEYDPHSFTLEAVKVKEGPKLVSYSLEQGPSPVLKVHKLCVSPPFQILRASQQNWTTAQVNLTNFSSNYMSTNVTISEILDKSPYAWIKCSNHGSELIVQPPVSIDQTNQPVSKKKDLDDRVTKLVASRPGKPLVDSVVSILLDAVSREKFKYLFPHLNNLLEDMSTDPMYTHHAVPLLRHNVVGYNSPPNKLAVYAGVERQHFHDEASWIMDIARHQGSEVAWIDCGINGAESLRKGLVHFQNSSESYPGDMSHWYARKSGRVAGDWNWPSGALLDTVKGYRGREVTSNCTNYRGMDAFDDMSGQFKYPLCAGNSLFSSHQLRYADEVLRYSRSHQKAVFLCFSHPHFPGKVFPYLDYSLVDFMQSWTRKSKDVNSNSAFVIWSDHGLHFSSETMSSGGSAAHKQPVAWVLLPKTKRMYDAHRALVQNSASLTSHFDLHLTFKHLLSGETETGRSRDAAYNGRSQSLLTPLIDPKRNCHDLGIPETFCPCKRDLACGVVGTAVERAEALSSEIWAGHLRSFEDHCSPLNLSSSWVEKSCQAYQNSQGKLVGTSIFSFAELHRSEALSLEVSFWRSENTGFLSVREMTSKHAWANSWGKCKNKVSEFNESIPRIVKELCICKNATN